MLAVKSVRLPSFTLKKAPTLNHRGVIPVTSVRPLRNQINFVHNTVQRSITKKTTIVEDSVQKKWRFYRNYSSDNQEKQSENQEKKEKDSYRVNIRNEEKYSTGDNILFVALIILIGKGSYDLVMSLFNISAHLQNDEDIVVPVWNAVEGDKSWRQKQDEVIGEDVTQSRLITKKEPLSLRVFPFLVEAIFPEEAIPDLPWYSRLKVFDVYSTFWAALPVSGSKGSGRIITKAQTHNGNWHVKRIEVLPDAQ
mmetsp:Transcript_20516/g.28778  ORF Transcript_20516/g.28778 Transcript_20516/m.28778 type:complete len:252 (+) Transcript_20516:10-765(+)